MIVYKITNKINGKCYIGQTIKKVEQRFKEHVRGYAKSEISSAIKQYGVENFDVKVLIKCSNKQELNDRETFCIKIFKSLYPNGYNLIESNDYWHITKEYKKVTTRKNPIFKNGHPMKGKKHSKETLRIISEKCKGRIPPNKGMQMSEKQKKKLSQIHMGKCPGKTFRRVRNKFSGEIVQSATELSKLLNIPFGTVTSRLLRNTKNFEWEYFEPLTFKKDINLQNDEDEGN